MRRFGQRCFPIALALVAACNEDSTSPTPTETAPSGSVSSAASLAFVQVSGGNDQTCGVTTAQRLYCWGRLAGTGNVDDKTSRPILVAGNILFSQVSVGYFHACALATTRLLYCWGLNGSGEVGDGTTTMRPTPVPVAGGRRFRQVSAGLSFTCATTYSDNVPYCWGDNSRGQLGDGSLSERRTPTRVVGSHQFNQVATGWYHACGITPDRRAYCWGHNRYGQLGDGQDVPRRTKPVPVAGGNQFRQIAAGFEHTCAVTSDSQAFCWGNGRTGAVGDGKTILRYAPRAVAAGGLRFERVTTGFTYSCGEGAGNLAYCWGTNGRGYLGDGTTTPRLKPVAVSGGLRFTQLEAGDIHACGVTGSGAAYCWGLNQVGQLGDGTTNESHVPVRVVDP